VAAAVAVASGSVAVALVGGGGHPAASAGAEGCALAVDFDGVEYLGTTVKRTLHLGRRLGRAFVEPCPDVIDSPPTPAAPSDGVVVAIAGIPSSVAVGAAGRPHTAYLADGYFPALPSHPLHEGSARNFTRGCRMTGRFSLVGKVRLHSSALIVQVDRSSGSLEVRPHMTNIQLLLDARTRIRGFERNGLPYVTAGDHLRSSGVTCQFQGTQSPAIVARTATPDR
jgi:Family of unknown function (DUF6281)